MREKFWLVGGVATVLLFLSVTADAVPAFARKYETSCMTCHESFPRLSATGEAFRLNGFKFLDDEIYIKEDPVELGDEAYKNLWPKMAVWPSSIPGTVPLSVVMNSQINYDVEERAGVPRTDFVFPNNVKLIGAGALGERTSFFVEVGFEQGGGGHGGHGDEEGGVETEIEGWIQFEDLLGPENFLNLRVGTVGMQELGLFTARDHNRMTINPYLYSSWSLPTVDHHELEEITGDDPPPEFDRNPFRLHGQPGIEVNGFGKRWRYAVGIVNGNGSASDNNSEKDLYLQLAYKFGGRTFDGSSSEGSALGSGEPWRDDSVMLSLFGYYGTETVEFDETNEEDTFWRIGPGIRWKYNRLALNTGYIFGKNDGAYGSLADTFAEGSGSVESESWFVEGEYVIYPWLTCMARYEGISFDLDSALFDDPDTELQRLVLGSKALIRANLSLALEGRFNTKEEGTTEGLGGDQVSLAMNIAF